MYVAFPFLSLRAEDMQGIPGCEIRTDGRQLAAMMKEMLRATVFANEMILPLPLLYPPSNVEFNCFDIINDLFSLSFRLRTPHCSLGTSPHKLTLSATFNTSRPKMVPTSATSEFNEGEPNELTRASESDRKPSHIIYPISKLIQFSGRP